MRVVVGEMQKLKQGEETQSTGGKGAILYSVTKGDLDGGHCLL